VASLFPEACLRGVCRFAAERDWHVVNDMMYTGTFPRGWKGDGVIALVGYDDGLVHHLQELAAPCVSISLAEDFVPFPTVAPDAVAVGRLAADHLLQRGHRTFAWAPFLHDQLHRGAFEAFYARLREHERRCHLLPAAHRRIGAFWHDDWGAYRRALESALQQLPKPVAVLAGNDAIAAEVVDACALLGLAVPDQVAVLGIGDNRCLCERGPVPISSVQYDIEEMAYRAAAMLELQMTGGGPLELVTRLEPRGVITRLSTDACEVGNSAVARALKHIEENFAQPGLTVQSVAGAVGLSRRQLERSVRTETGATISEHILKRRMEEASRLLRAHPRAKVAEISELVGYEVPRNFFRTFRRHFGESPHVHRRPVLTPTESGLAKLAG
jgi:LacI family transcriptional regulator